MLTNKKTKHVLYEWLLNHLSANNVGFIDELKPFIKTNQSPLYRGFSVNQLQNNNQLNIYLKSFSSSFDTAYDFAQMSSDSDINIVKIDEKTAPIIYLIDIYNELKNDFSFDPQIQLLLQNEKEYIIVAYKLFIKPENTSKNLTNKNINIYKGEFF